MNIKPLTFYYTLKYWFFLCAVAISITLFCSASAVSSNLEEQVAWLYTLGYKVTDPLETFRLSHPDWEAVQLMSKSLVGIKSSFPICEGGRYFYRFTLVEEVYSNEGAAKKRIEMIRKPPDRILPSQRKSYALRRGFRVGRIVYLINTDAVMFKRKMVSLGNLLVQLHSTCNKVEQQQVLKKFQNSIPKCK